MKKQELLQIIDQELLEKLFGFCYARTSDSQEAQELCSDILFQLIKAANTEGDIESPHGFLWRVARNTYADFLHNKKRNSDRTYQGDPEELFSVLESREEEDDSRAMLDMVYRRIAFLTRAYREVMILFYLEGLPVAEIARRQDAGEGAVRQRLSLARKRIQREVEEMAESDSKPVVLDRIEYNISGSGDPCWGDPRKVCTRQFSKHLVWLCRKKSVSPAEAAQELHVPTVYVEEELEILRQGENGQYGLLRRMDNGRGTIGMDAIGMDAAGRYGINFILFDKEEIQALWDVYQEQIPAVCRIVSGYVQAHREEYLAFPYLNRVKDWNLILWQQMHRISGTLVECVAQILSEKYFAQVETHRRSFNVFGHAVGDRIYTGGWDSTEASEICGYSHIHLESISNARVRPHFWSGHDVANDIALQLAIRAVEEGLVVDSLSEREREYAARAIECGYLYREEDRLYTKILVCEKKDYDRLFHITDGLCRGHLTECAEAVAEKLSGLIRRFVPGHLLGEWEFANQLAGLNVLDALMEHLTETGILAPTENGLGAEGCWMCVER